MGKKIMKMETNNKKFVYELDNRKNLIIYRSNIFKENNYKQVVTGLNITSFVFKKDDKYLFLLSKSSKIIYTYLINKLNGLLILSSKNYVYKNLEKLKISKSDNYLCVYNNKNDYLIYSINETNGNLIIFNEDTSKKIFNEEFNSDFN